MKPVNWSMKVLLTLLLTAGSSNLAMAAFIAEVSPGSTGPTSCGGCGLVSGSTNGWQFDLSSSIMVNGLAIWDFESDGLGRDAQVGLWEFQGSLLASATITDATPVEPSADGHGWRTADIGPLTLDAGTYVLGFTAFSDVPLATLDPFLATIPAVSNVTGVYNGVVPDTGFQRPDQTFLVPSAIVGPNLRLGTVPEPSTIALLLAAGLGLRLARRQ